MSLLDFLKDEDTINILTNIKLLVGIAAIIISITVAMYMRFRSDASGTYKGGFFFGTLIGVIMTWLIVWPEVEKLADVSLIILNSSPIVLFLGILLGGILGLISGSIFRGVLGGFFGVILSLFIINYYAITIY